MPLSDAHKDKVRSAIANKGAAGVDISDPWNMLELILDDWDGLADEAALDATLDADSRTALEAEKAVLDARVAEIDAELARLPA